MAVVVRCKHSRPRTGSALAGQKPRLRGAGSRSRCRKHPASRKLGFWLASYAPTHARTHAHPRAMLFVCVAEVGGHEQQRAEDLR